MSGPPPGNHPYGGYPPPPQGYHAPPYPQQQGGFPPQGYGGPPPPHFQQGPYSQGPPPAQGYAPPGPLHQQYGHPPPGQYPPPMGGYGPPPSPGYDPRAQAQGDASHDADELRKAMKGFGTDEATLIRILSKPDPLQMALLRNTYNQRHRRDLEKDIKSETSKWFQEGLLALVRGPLMQDVHLLHNAIKGLGTKESSLNDVLLGRSNADMQAIKQAYHQTYHRTLEADVRDDLSLKTEELFTMVLSATRAEESSPVIPQDLERDVSDLHQATSGKIGNYQITVCSILAHRSDGQIRAIAPLFQQKYHMSLETRIEREFSGHMKEALVLMLRRATDRAMTDAVQLEDTMAGPGTRDQLLVNRVVRIHWDRAHLDQVKRAYAHRYKRDLIQRVRGEIHLDKHYENLMVAVLS